MLESGFVAGWFINSSGGLARSANGFMNDLFGFGACLIRTRCDDFLPMVVFVAVVSLA